MIGRQFPTVSALLLGLILQSVAWAQQREAPRSPRYAERQQTTREAAQALREATSSSWRIHGDEQVGTPIWAEFAAGVDALPPVLKASTPRAAVETFLARHGELWGRPALSSSLREVSEKIDPQGGVHYFYQQTYRGVDVHGAELGVFVAADRSGAYAVETIYGRFHPDIEIDVTPTLSADGAADALAAAAQAAEPWEVQASELNVVLVEAAYRLAWRVELVAANGGWVGLVDALDGTILARFELGDTRGSTPADASPASPREVASRTGESPALQGSWTTCSGANVHDTFIPSFTCFFTGSTYELRDNTNPSAHEIRVYDNALPNDPGACDDPINISRQADRDWVEDDRTMKCQPGRTRTGRSISTAPWAGTTTLVSLAMT